MDKMDKIMEELPVLAAGEWVELAFRCLDQAGISADHQKSLQDLVKALLLAKGILAF